MQPEKVIEGGRVFWEYDGYRYPDELNHGDAAAHVADRAAMWCKGTGIDVGAGKYPFPNAFPVRDREINAYNLSCFVNESLDYVFSSHCLEHLERPAEAIMTWAGKLKPDGVLFLYLPHPDMKLWRPGAPWVKSAHKWSPDFKSVSEMMTAAGIGVVAGDGTRDDFWSFYVVGKKQ